MAQSTWADVSPKAKRLAVYYEGSNTIYEGMLVHYNHDTTTNWSNIDKSAAEGAATFDTSTPEGSQNEGKWIRVEEPSDANRRFCAGVVAKGSDGIGQSGPSVIDIYCPNGAIVPVYTDRSVSINDPAYMEVGQNTVVNVDLGGEQIGWFMETIDRSNTAGLALVCLQMPEQSQVAALSTLGIGLSPLLWGDAPKPILGQPSGAYDYFNDFDHEVDSTTGDGWTLTQVDTKGTLTVEAVAPGGVVLFTNGGDSADDGVNAQLKNVSVLPAAGTNIWFETRLKISDATQQWLAGLAAVDTTLIASGVLDDTVDKVGFVHAAADTDDKVSTFTARTSAEDETSDAGDMTDDTYTTLGFKIIGLTQVEFYQDGALIETGVTAANIPNAAMCLSFVSQYEGGAGILAVDWVKIVASAGRDA